MKKMLTYICTNNFFIVKTFNFIKMKNVVGQTPRKDDFFPRNMIENRIYRRLETANLYLAAPRRVGKTSIMRHLEDEPRAGFHFIYIITESAHDTEGYYEKLLDEILKSDVIGKLAKRKEQFANVLNTIFKRIEKIKTPFGELDLSKREKETFQAAFEELLKKCGKADEIVVIMIDEFPQTVENIRDKSGNEEAERFLRLNREQRQQAASNIRFIYTGSIGLPMVVKKLTSLSVINDLNTVEIQPLSYEEAEKMATTLLNNYKIEFEPDLIPYLLDKIKWLIPFHIQLAVQELIDVYEMNETPLQAEDADRAFLQLLNIRNNIYFDHYYSRLQTAFPQKEYQFALQFLDTLSEANTLLPMDVLAIAKQTETESNYPSVLESLIYDGYIHQEEETTIYRFNSYLLQRWWAKKHPH
jgi:uncharacterized protein